MHVNEKSTKWAEATTTMISVKLSNCTQLNPSRVLMWNLQSCPIQRAYWLTKYLIIMYTHTHTVLIVYIPSGSDQSRSHMPPSWGTSCFRSIDRIWSRVVMEGERPPWTQKIYRRKENTKNSACMYVFTLYGHRYGWNVLRRKGNVTKYKCTSMANWIKLLSITIITGTCQQFTHTKQTFVYTYLAVHDGRETEIVKYLGAVSPYIDWTIFSLTFIIKSIHLYSKEIRCETRDTCYNLFVLFTWVICLLSWFPRISVILSGYRT